MSETSEDSKTGGEASGMLDTVFRHRLVPVIRLDDPGHAQPLAETLLGAGLPVMEITFRSDAAERSLRRVDASGVEVLLGAGTVLTVEQVKRAVDAGARFIVTPGFNPRVVEYCVTSGIPVTPGVNDPSAVEAALEYGLTVLKFFPAEASGGIPMVRALAGPYGHVRFIPTGGIGPENLSDYLSLKNVAAVGGSWMVSSDAIAAGDWETIASKTRDAVKLVSRAG
ncbi:MAG: bifunctional 4-hydroxy-2-oxoglutarate aldolase/2-dehydro-3-deoxy-phosphogluconate aldolase [Spirochaetales bacterium]